MLKGIIEGNLGNPPEVRQTSIGMVTSFSVAHTERKKDAQGNYQNGDTTWVKITVFKDDISYMNLQQGTKVRVEGNLKHTSYVSQDGQEKWSLEMIVYANNIFPIPKKPQQQQNGGGQNWSQNSNQQQNAPQWSQNPNQQNQNGQQFAQNPNGNQYGQQQNQNGGGQNWSQNSNQQQNAPQWNQQPQNQNIPTPVVANVPPPTDNDYVPF